MKMNEKKFHFLESFPIYYMVTFYHDLIDNHKIFGKKFQLILINKGITLKIINNAVTKNQNINMFNKIHDCDMDQRSYNLANETLLLVKYYFMSMNSHNEFIYKFNMQLYHYKVAQNNRQVQPDILFQRPLKKVPSKSRIQIIQKIEENLKEITEVENPHEECCVCMESYEKQKYVMLNCKHELCIGCCKTIICFTTSKRICPYCRTIIKSITVEGIDTANEFTNRLK
jgi:hypothetical protein